jgi:hypothetical protein
MADVLEVIWGGRKEEYFLNAALTGNRAICPTGRIKGPFGRVRQHEDRQWVARMRV